MREGALLSAGDLAQLRYPPERVVTGIVQDLPANVNGAGVVPVVDVKNLENDDLIAVLTRTTTRQNSTVVKQVNVDNFTGPQVDTDSEPDGSATTLERWAAYKNMLFQVVNTSGSVAVSNYQAGAAVWRLYGSLAERLRIANSGDINTLKLTEQDHADLDLVGRQHFLDQVMAGLRPLMPDDTIDRQEISWRSYPVATTINTSSTQLVSVARQTPTRPGYAVALGELSIDTSVGGSITLANQVSDDIQVHVNRDTTNDIDVWPGYLASNGMSTIFKPWIVGRDSVTVELSAKSAVNNVPIKCVFYEFPVSEILHVRWNTPTGKQIAKQRPKFAAQVRLGLF